MERVRQKIELDDLATTLKITEANLRAVEDGDASKLPSDLYFKLFAKSYSEELGIDYEATIEAIQQDIDESLMSEGSSPLPYDADLPDKGGDQVCIPAKDVGTGKNGNQLKKLAYLLGTVLLVFIVVVVGNEFLFQDSELENESDSVTSAVVEPEETTATSSSDDTVGYDWNVPVYAEPEPMTLVLVARAESWASIFADGDTAIYRTLTPERRYEVTAKYRLRVSVGVPSVVTIELNGQPVNLRNPESGRIAGVEIDQVNLQTMLKRPMTQPPRPSAPPSQTPRSSATPETTTTNAVDTGGTSSEEVAPAPVNRGTPEDTSDVR